MEPKHARNIKLPAGWFEEIEEALKEADAPASVSAFMRAGIREKLDRVQSAKELRAVEERQAATLARIVEVVSRLEKAVQTHLALQDAFVKAILTHLPEPADMSEARRVGQARYGKVVEHAAGQLAGKVNGHV